MTAREVLLERDEIADLEPPPLPRDLADLFDRPDVFVTEDARHDLVARVRRHVAAADAGRDDAQQARVGRDLGQRNLAHFGRFHARLYRGT